MKRPTFKQAGRNNRKASVALYHHGITLVLFGCSRANSKDFNAANGIAFTASQARKFFERGLKLLDEATLTRCLECEGTGMDPFRLQTKHAKCKGTGKVKK